MMKPSKRLVLASGAAVVLLWWSLPLLFGWPPILRTKHYYALIAAFDMATPIEKIRSDEKDPGWDSAVKVAGQSATIQVSARSHMDVVAVKYSDDRQPRRLYKYVDYSHPQALKRSGDMLYVYWTESLFRTDHYLLVYDLANRREIERRRVDSKDMPQR